MTTEQMKVRTKQFGLQVLKLYAALPKREEARVIGRQLLRSATSVGANYRAVCRARSDRDFLSKLGVVIEETDETLFWLELLAEGDIMPAAKLSALTQEANELLAIFGATQRTIKARLSQKKATTPKPPKK
ncbi:MAG: four helix bundle protein [Anaerolineae bacterium]|nr:four helix bundle protein [Candidatus Roseilinea sp.]MDW8451052.1 four helix bundle protein [Anaerolineae bacterium]